MKIVRVSREIEIIRRNRKLERRVSFVGSNEKSYYYILHKNILESDSIQNEDFICGFFIEQMKIVCNNKIQSHRETSSRNIKIQTLYERYVGRGLSLIEDNPNFTTLHDILDKGLIDKGIDIDLALTHVNLNESYENFIKKNSHVAINVFMKKHTPNSILHDHVAKFCESYEDFYGFRKEFTYYYSTAMYFSYILGNSMNFLNYFWFLES